LDRRGPLHPGWLTPLREPFAARSAPVALAFSFRLLAEATGTLVRLAKAGTPPRVSVSVRESG
jgi:hypothetical protein